MELFDPTILHMVLILPGLLGLSLLYEGVFKRHEGEPGWKLSVVSGILVLGFVVILFFVFKGL